MVETGEGDVSEIAELVSDGKLMFAYLRKEMSETWKFVLIAWCGDGVPANIKGFFPTHKEEMEAFLRKNNFNYSALISAREESDLDESEIVKALNKTSTFIRARTAKDKPAEKLDDVRNRFWSKQKKEEESYQEAMAARQKAKEAEAQASLESDRERMRRQAEDVLAQREAEREEAARMFQAEEAARTQKQATYFEQQRQRVIGGLEEGRSAPAPAASAARGPAPVTRGNAAARFLSACKKQEEEEAAPAPAPRTAPRPAARRPAPAPQPEPEPEPEPQQEEQSSWGATETYEEPAPEPAAAEETYEEPAQQQEEQYQEEGAAGIGQARALYDYDAAQEGDLSFREGDVITLIDTSDPSGWWVGELNGAQGNFPSNFVEQI